jgi:molybdenum cofactor cytidylyltransferase
LPAAFSLQLMLQAIFLRKKRKRYMQRLTSIVPIILAAGDSTRMGYPKALLPLGSDTFLIRILKTLHATEMPKPMIILGRADAAIRPQIQEWSADIYINPDPDRGQLSSIQLALSHISPESIACMIWPVDQPAVSENLVRRLTELFLNSDSRITCPICGNRRGHPAIFHRALFQEFMDAPLEEGPKKIIIRHQQATVLLPTEEAGSVQDIDTPAEYEALTGESLSAALARLQMCSKAQ